MNQPHFNSLPDLIPDLNLTAIHQLPLLEQLRLLPLIFAHTYGPIVGALFKLENVDDKMSRDIENLKSCFWKCEATLTKSVGSVLAKPALAAVIAGLPIPEITVEQRISELEAEVGILRLRVR